MFPRYDFNLILHANAIDDRLDKSIQFEVRVDLYSNFFSWVVNGTVFVRCFYEPECNGIRLSSFFYDSDREVMQEYRQQLRASCGARIGQRGMLFVYCIAVWQKAALITLSDQWASQDLRSGCLCDNYDAAQQLIPPFEYRLRVNGRFPVKLNGVDFYYALLYGATPMPEDEGEHEMKITDFERLLAGCA